MIKGISIKNFQSIEEQSIELAPLTLLYGKASTGKSSLLYSILTLKNFFINPNQTADNLFYYGFLNLGGFEWTVFDHKLDREIDLSLEFEEGSLEFSFNKSRGKISLKYDDIELFAEVPIPYYANLNFPHNIKYQGNEYIVNWNGIVANVTPKIQNQDLINKAQELNVKINSIYEKIKKITIVPSRRGFFKPIYSITQTAYLLTDDELATVLMNDPDLVSKVSLALEEIADKQFRVHNIPGTTSSYLIITDRNSKIATLLPNEGFGINQLVYILTKVYIRDVETVLIEEPEIHLHPTLIRNFMKFLCKVIEEEGKQIILTTHSETLVSSLLARVKEGLISNDKIKCYLVSKEKRRTIFEEQKVYKNGQIEGGLREFIEGEIEDLKVFLE